MSLENKKEKLLELFVDKAISNAGFKKRNDASNQELEQAAERHVCL